MALSQCIKRRHLAQKNLKFHAGVKKCHFGNFSERAGMAVPCQCSPQESLGGSEKFFLHWVPMNSQQCWKAKLERALFCRVQSGKITVCSYDNLTSFSQIGTKYAIRLTLCIGHDATSFAVLGSINMLCSATFKEDLATITLCNKS